MVSGPGARRLMTADDLPQPVIRLGVALWRESDHLVAHIQALSPPHDYGVVALHELTLLLEALVEDVETET